MIFNGIELTPVKLKALIYLAACPTGSTHIEGVVNGGTLATLVQMGLAKRVDGDRSRYVINEAGLALVPPAEEEAL